MAFVGKRRPLEGIRAHRKIQRSRPEGYEAEVSVSHTVETDRFTLTVGGRIDGVFRENGRTVVEEIKTTGGDVDLFTPDRFGEERHPLHWAQAKVYAWFYVLRSELDAVDVQLTYHHLDGGKTLEFRRSFGRADLEAFFADLMDRYLFWAGMAADWAGERDRAARKLAFPFPGFRTGQRKMAVAVYRAVRDGGQLLVQAPTGIGKTLAALFPAVKALGEGVRGKIFYLTARTTGRIAAEKALAELRSGGLRIKSLTLTAKEKVCPAPEAACAPEECPGARGYFDRLDDAVREIFQRDAWDRAAVAATAETFGICPFAFSLELSLWADCVVCDYNYAFDPRVHLRRFFAEGEGPHILLVDEAHNLVDRSREMFSAELRRQPFRELRKAVKKEIPGLSAALGEIDRWMAEALKRGSGEAPSRSEPEAPEALYPHLRRVVSLAEKWLVRHPGPAPFREALLDLYFAAGGFLRVAEAYDGRYATCYDRQGRDLRVKLFCIDPSPRLGEALGRGGAAVLFSATLTPGEYFKKIFGCGPSAGYLTLPSPFPPQNLGVFFSDRVSTLFRDRERTVPHVAGALRALAAGRPGNYLFFFPAYAYMAMVHGAFLEGTNGEEILVQRPEMSEEEREAFLRRFDRPPAGADTLIGFAVMGGIFGEGIDLVGDRLSGAAVVGVGLPGVCTERELIRDHFDRERRAGFDFAYRFPGINRVLQAAGRVIRSETDRGVVLFIDRRFGDRRYAVLLPEEWRPRTARDPVRLGDDLKTFWNGGGRPKL